MKDLLKDLDPAQKEAVLATDGPVLILAGAGSGKTRVLTYKVAHLIASGVDSTNILASTFTNKAANEMKERVIRLLGWKGGRIIGQKTHHPAIPPSHIPFVGTFHAFCARLLRLDGKFIGIPTGYLIYDDDDSLSLVKRVMTDLGISTKSFRPSSILGAISSAKSELLGQAEYTEFARGHFAETVAKVYRQYQKELHAANACDFDDLLMRTVELFKKEPRVLDKWAGRFKYVLVDEYQDVNTAQYTLTKMLASIHGNLTVVGDASQAIYSFRGADFRNILNFERDFPNVKVFNLEQNYRSTKVILDAANEVISKNSSHPILRLWTKNGSGEKITIYNAQNEISEANFIVETVVSSGKPLSRFAILYRTNAQSRAIEEAFLHTNIPYKLYGGVSFYARKEIKDVMAYLRLIASPKDRISRNRVEKLGKRRFDKFQTVVKKLSSSVIASPVTQYGVNSAKQSKKGKIASSSTIPRNDSLLRPLELIDKVLDATDYLSLIDDGTEQGLMRVENVKELKSVAADFENLDSFLESVTLMEGKVAPEKSYEAESDSVKLMTLHAAKGLEFDNVFIIGMEEGLFPHSRSMMDPQQIEEERRLAYVGMTRAKKKLYLTYASNRLYIGQQSTNLVSRFVVDIPEGLITAI